MIVARIGVAALAVREAIADRVVVIALDALDAVLLEQRTNTVGVGAESAKVAQAVNGLDAA